MGQPGGGTQDFRAMTLSVALQHRFAGFALDAAFEAPEGVTALFGRSGSGKSTMVNAVAGLLRPDKGRITLDGSVLLDTDLGRMLAPHRRRMGYVFQDGRLFPHLTVQQNLLYGRWFAPKGQGAEIGRIVDLLGIAPLLDRRPAALSGGEKQRVAIGRAILSNLERLRDEVRLPILYVSHSVAEVARLATTVILMEAGRVLASGPAIEVLADPAIAPAMGLREAGSMIIARVAAQEEDGLTRLETGGGPVFLPGVKAQAGATLRLRILAQDVMLATERPHAISALNVLAANVEDIRLGDGPGAMVQLRMGEERLLARVTRRSVRVLGLRPGVPVYAVLKTVSVGRENVGTAS
jgi:molybdate transport system ATP-binding protein